MARLFPFRSEPSTGEGQPRVVDLEGEDADAVFGALSSTTARRIYARLDDEPGTPSDVADAIDSSIQNVRYHLENLEGAGLVEVVDTWYSSRGNEMSVYATTDGPLIVTSDESRASQLRTALSRLIGGIGALAGGSLLVQHGVTRWFGTGTESDGFVPTGGEDSADESDSGDVPAGDDAADDDRAADEQGESGDETVGDGPSEDSEAEEDAADDFTMADSDDENGENGADSADEASANRTDADTGSDGYETSDDGATAGNGDIEGTETVADGGNETLADGGAEAADAVFGTIPPGLLFFLGGLVVLLAATLYWYWYRPAY
ncbi:MULTISPECIES: helix-turn-helix domain-containing protein [Natrialbaceae]|uniref:helix-turn-helix domain-containing protein n=1 Tax=Natrialbaceae TaxID=1644061 RepID=UPI00207C8CC6|nr:helix-turn-helix domain-containing protein [Natronococcus sp. CG52]